MNTFRLTSLAVVVAIVASGTPVRVRAAEGDPETANVSILEIVDSRAARLPAIERLKAAGVLGESNQGLIAIVGLDPIEDPDLRAEAARVARAENADRERLYALLASSGDGGDRDARLKSIRAKYAEIMRDAAQPGDWIQLPDGSWKPKDADEDRAVPLID